jgi:AcrR family transcriptional regulator
MTDKREQILLAAEELFGTSGFDGTSVRDIAQAADVNLAMISYYFGSKEKLLEALIEQRSKYTVGILEELNKDESLNSWDKLDRLVDFYVDRIINNPCFHNIMHNQAGAARSEEVRERIINLKLNNFEQVRKIFLEGQRKKLFRKVDIELTMSSVIGTISHFTLSRDLTCRLLNIDLSNEESYRKKITQRLKAHLKQMLHAHLDIRNEESTIK